jgi:nucleotide-binding universal stress UspA family protein
MIICEVETWKASAILGGPIGLGRLGRVIGGSVASAVAVRAHCSIEVVRSREGP